VETSLFFDIPSFLDYLRSDLFTGLLPLLIKVLPQLVWTMLVPILLYRNAQGREILVGLFDDAEGFSALRAGVLIFMFHVLCMAIFLSPLPLFSVEHANRIASLKPILGQHPYMVVLICTIPMIFYGVSMAWIQYRRYPKWWKLVLVAVSLGLSGYLTVRHLHRTDLRLADTVLWSLVNMIGTAGVLLIVGRWLRGVAEPQRGKYTFWNYFVIGFGMCMQITLTAAMFKIFDLQRAAGELWWYNFTYLMLLGFIVGIVVFLGFAWNPQYLSPIFVLMCISLFYLLLGDLVIATIGFFVKTRQFWWAGLSAVLLGLAVWVIFFRKKTKLHDVHLVPSEVTSADRATLDAFWYRWWRTNLQPLADDPASAHRPIPIYLMATQGGGSRAGLWVSAVANALDEKMGGQFRRHLFAVTSASGGSAGFGATLGLWRFFDEHPSLSAADRVRIQREFGDHMFGRNYLSNQLIQLGFNEVLKRFVLLLKKNGLKNRNYFHQLDESLALAAAIRRGYESQPGTRRPIWNTIWFRMKALFDRGDRPVLDAGAVGAIPNYQLRPYLSYWYDADKRLDARLPLYFPVTTHVQSGVGGYASPVQCDPECFVKTIDVVAAAERGQPDQSLPLVGATNLSQLFPVMNAFTYLPDTGNFIDGGMFENQGLPLSYRLYEFLETKINALDPALRQRVKIQVIYVVNSAVVSEYPSPKDSERMGQLNIPTRIAAFGGIAGRTIFWQEFLRQRAAAAGVPVAEYVLQYRDTPDIDTVPLGRWLSRRSVAHMSQMAKTRAQQQAILVP
jgi:hypothetical protein